MRARGRSSFYQSRHHGYPRGWNVAAPSAPLNSGAKHRMRSSPCTHDRLKLLQEKFNVLSAGHVLTSKHFFNF